MSWISQHPWFIPLAPLLAAAVSALLKREQRNIAANLAIGAMLISLALSLAAFGDAVHHSGGGEVQRHVVNFNWFQFGDGWLRLGWVLDPLTAVMLVMITFVGLWIFIYSLGYMAHDENFTRFFCFLSLFAAAMLGLVIANSLLLLFICWELVGLTSYLLIGFWYHKPAAAAAAKKAFITTRIGDLALLLGMVWLYSQAPASSLLFYDNGSGCLEAGSLAGIVAKSTTLRLTVSTGIGLLIFCGAVGKSGQVPLHVWLPDAMEGPTPVSALIHAATMVAAGVFLVARMYPLMQAHPSWGPPPSGSLQVITWLGAITAVFAASIAVAQNDIKRILAYSTVSQLGFMMLGLGVGGVAVGMFHLITHAFFKALLFLGAGSVIHGCHNEQDVRCMGGLRKFMPVTFAAYAVGMLALCGFPLFFSGFWSKDEILHAARHWTLSQGPFYLGIIGAFLTAFYMTRQVFHVFFGNCRVALGKTASSEQRTIEHAGLPAREHPHRELSPEPHESPHVMTRPLLILAGCSVLLGFIGTPAWRWFQSFLEGGPAEFDFGRLFESSTLTMMGLSTVVVFAGLGLGYYIYGRKPLAGTSEPDALEHLWPNLFYVLRHKFFIDEAYAWAFGGLTTRFSQLADAADRIILGGLLLLISYLVLGIAWLDRVFDEWVVNFGFDETCRRLRENGRAFSRMQSGRIQNYLRIIGLALIVLVLGLIWGCRAS